MRYNTLISTVLTILTILTTSCTSLPTPILNPVDCLSRFDCRVVTIDNTSNQSNVEFRLNDTKLGEIPAYSTGVYTVNVNRLVHGNCAVATARFIGSQSMIRSDERCINTNEYYQVTITTHPYYVWLTPFRIR